MDYPTRVLDESEAGLASFHDCHAHGLRWNQDQFSSSLEIQYIMKWIEPTKESSGYYHFLVAEARLLFLT